jgi:PAS domain S-box-containing protein
VALIPLRVDHEIIGLLQLNDRRKDMFTLETIRFFEGIGASIGVTFERKQAENELQTQRYYLEKAQEMGSIGTWELDIEKNILNWTSENYRIFGIPKGTGLTYETFLDCVHPDDREYVDREWKAALENKPFDIEHRIIVEGQTKWVREKAEVQSNEKGDCSIAIGFTRDITKRKRAKQELENVARFPSENPYPIFRICSDSKMLYANEVSIALLGDSNSGVGEPGPQWCVAIATRVLKSGSIERAEIEHAGRFFAFRAVPVTKAGYVNFYGVDITEQKKAEDDARRHLSELTHVSRLGTIGQMATELAHELNQPLCATLTHLEGCLGMLKSGSSDTDRIVEKLETAAKQTDRAGTIVSRVKGFAMKGRGKRSTVFVNDVVREAMGFMEREMRQNHITVESDLGEDIPPVFADPIQIEQVVLNLIQNAAEAMEDTPKEQRRLTVSTRMLAGSVEVAVKDAGKGIDTDQEENIFKSFVTTKSGGLGVGLSISQSIVSSHGGRIYFRENPDYGITFCFTLPVRAEKA